MRLRQKILGGFFAAAFVAAGGTWAYGWTAGTGITGSPHDFFGGESGKTGNGNGTRATGFVETYGEICVVCHTPHGANTGKNLAGQGGPLWNRSFSADAALYKPYVLSGIDQQMIAPTVPALSTLCLGCHDGTVGIDQFNTPYAWGNSNTSRNTDVNNIPAGSAWAFIAGNGNGPGTQTIDKLSNEFVIGTTTTHPIGFSYSAVQAADKNGLGGASAFVAPSAAAGGADGAGVTKHVPPNAGATTGTPLPLFSDTVSGLTDAVECMTCHSVHNWGDTNADFLLRVCNSATKGGSNTGGPVAGQVASGLCLSCHVK